MKKLNSNTIFWHISLFLISFLLFSIQFHEIIFSPNSLLATASGDGIHGYYSYLNHIINNKIGVHTNGLNYPFGEHLVYTDAQPFLATLIQLLPFLKPYAIGVMHLVLFFSFLLCANVYFKIFELFNVNKILAFCSALAIVLLSPQLGRLGGHFALAFSLPIPLCIYFSLSFYFKGQQKYIYYAISISVLAFFTHPYLGLGTTIFSLLFYFISQSFQIKKVNFQKAVNFVLLLLPIIIFKGFMYLTDTHFNRPAIPYGETIYISSFKSVFIPYYKPFIGIFGLTNDLNADSWEGLSYIGIAMSLLIIITLILSFKIKINSPILILIIISVFFLLFSFGYISNILKVLGIQPMALKQFRGLGRFAWYFYYCAPIIVIVIINDFIKIKLNNYKPNLIYISIGLIFLSFNIIEANEYHRNIKGPIFNEQNYFLENKFTNEQKKIISIVKTKSYQAILPLPFYHLGSEVYHRALKDVAHLSMIISFQTKLPIIGHLGSRTSLNETEASIGVLNEYREKPKLKKLFNNKPILILQQGDLIKPEEERLLRKAKYISEIGNLKLFEIDANTLLNVNSKIYNNFLNLSNDTISKNIFKISNAKSPFYQWAKTKDFNKLLILDSNTFESGNYIVTFRYHFKQFNLKDINGHFIIESYNSKGNNWDFFGDIHYSQRYPNYFVFEQKVKLDSKNKYVFFINHDMSDGTYYVSNFCLRPDTLNYFEKRNGKVVSINNYPINN